MNTKNTLKIGITGGIGTGKSIICKIFALLGVPVYDADKRAKWLLSNDLELIKQIKQHFGDEAYQHPSNSENRINKKFLSERIFKNRKDLDLLNSLVHPKVGIDFEKWFQKNSHYSYILKEAALLYESGNYKTLDKMVTVYAPLQLRIKRILQRDKNRTEDNIKAIIASQISEDEKIKKADFVLYNDEKQMLIPQVLKLHNSFI